MPVLLLFVLLLLPQPALSAADSFTFAESLAADGDHYRAITEYKRFLHYQPLDPRAAEAQLAITTALLAGKRWLELDRELHKVWQNYPDSTQAIQARKRYAEAALLQQNYAEARQRYAALKKLSPPQTKAADYQIGLSHLYENRPDAAELSFAQLPDTDRLPLLSYLDDYRQLPRKSPAVAGTLSALLPGAGQLYTERPKQAAMAFTLNAAFIYATVEAWQNENYAVAGLLTLFEFGWYGGNIYNAMNNAHKYNRQQQNSFRQRLQEQFRLSLGWREQSPLLQAKFRF